MIKHLTDKSVLNFFKFVFLKPQKAGPTHDSQNLASQFWTNSLQWLKNSWYRHPKKGGFCLRGIWAHSHFEINWVIFKNHQKIIPEISLKSQSFFPIQWMFGREDLFCLLHPGNASSELLRPARVAWFFSRTFHQSSLNACLFGFCFFRIQPLSFSTLMLTTQKATTRSFSHKTCHQIYHLPSQGLACRHAGEYGRRHDHRHPFNQVTSKLFNSNTCQFASVILGNMLHHAMLCYSVWIGIPDIALAFSIDFRKSGGAGGASLCSGQLQCIP